MVAVATGGWGGGAPQPCGEGWVTAGGGLPQYAVGAVCGKFIDSTAAAAGVPQPLKAVGATLPPTAVTWTPPLVVAADAHWSTTGPAAPAVGARPFVSVVWLCWTVSVVVRGSARLISTCLFCSRVQTLN